MADTITLAIDALASAAFIEGGVSIERTEEARVYTEQRKRELIEAIAVGQPQAVAAQAPAAVAVPDGLKLERGFRWDSEKLEHVPTLLVEFTPVPANSPSDAKGWADRDALAIALSATPVLPATEDSSAGDLATESVLIEGVAYTIPEPVALELLRLNIELQQAEVQAEPVAWLHTDRIGGVQAFTTEPPPSLKAKCQPLYTAPQAQPADARPLRTDAEIVKQTEALAKYLLHWKWGQEPESPDAELRNSSNHKAQVCWQAACEIQELITDTDVENAVAEVEAAMAAAQEGSSV